jgi:GntR family transcriptional activator of glc operon
LICPIDRQHARLYNAVRSARVGTASVHVNRVRERLNEIEQEQQRLMRVTLRLKG